MVGPLERLGIRDFGQAVMLGGKGILRFPDHELDLRRFHHLGIAVRDALIIEGIEFPAGGLLVVENLTPFQTCVDLLADKRQLLVLWSAGFPGRGVLAVIRKAANCGARIRVWCDLDLGGVRIARTMARVAGNLESVLMDSSTVASSETILPLSPEQVAALRRELYEVSCRSLVRYSSGNPGTWWMDRTGNAAGPYGINHRLGRLRRRPSTK